MFSGKGIKCNACVSEATHHIHVHQHSRPDQEAKRQKSSGIPQKKSSSAFPPSCFSKLSTGERNYLIVETKMQGSKNKLDEQEIKISPSWRRMEVEYKTLYLECLSIQLPLYSYHLQAQPSPAVVPLSKLLNPYNFSRDAALYPIQGMFYLSF